MAEELVVAAFPAAWVVCVTVREVLLFRDWLSGGPRVGGQRSRRRRSR